MTSHNFRILLCLFLLLLMEPATITAKTAQPDSSPASDSQAIINGSAASTLTYPWMVFFADEFGQQYCGGSLIAPTWILSAGHCFLNEDGTEPDLATAARSSVILNSDTVSPLSPSAIVAEIGQIIIHPLYQPDFETSPNADDFDLALVEITAAVDLEPVQLLSPQDAPLTPGTPALILGWGTTLVNDDNESTDPSNNLLRTNQLITSAAECFGVFPDRLTDNMVCAGGLDAEDSSDSCQGDSGGPLFIAANGRFVLVGAASFGGTDFGPVCGDPEAPAVYASVPAMADFISSNVPEAQFANLAAGNPPASAPVIAATTDGTRVFIDWTAYSGATGYTLFYAPYPALEPVMSVDMGAALEISGELPVGSAYYIAVQPYDDIGALEVLSNIEVFEVLP